MQIEEMLTRYRLVPTGLLRDFLDDDTCSFDHHGGCQTHGYLSLDPGEKCPMLELREIVEEEPRVALQVRPEGAAKRMWTYRLLLGPVVVRKSQTQHSSKQRAIQAGELERRRLLQSIESQDWTDVS